MAARRSIVEFEKLLDGEIALAQQEVHYAEKSVDEATKLIQLNQIKLTTLLEVKALLDKAVPVADVAQPEGAEAAAERV